MFVQTASVNVDCRKAEWLECFISCIIGCHTPAGVVKVDEERRSEPHGTSKHNSELLRQGSVTGVILVGRSDSLGFHNVTRLVGF